MKRIDNLLIGVIITLALSLFSASVFAICVNIIDLKKTDIAADEANVLNSAPNSREEVSSEESSSNEASSNEAFTEEISSEDESPEKIPSEDGNIDLKEDTVENLAENVPRINNENQASKLIILDPGHGGIDPGKDVGTTYEKDINISVSLIIKDILEKNGYTVYMTREGDEYKGLNDRVYFENQYYDRLFVSIHCNSNIDPSVKGIELYYYNSRQDADNIAYYLASSGYNINSFYNDFRVLKYAKEDSVLIEIGYLSNPDDFILLTDPVYQSILAHDVANAIIYTLSNK